MLTARASHFVATVSAQSVLVVHSKVPAANETPRVCSASAILPAASFASVLAEAELESNFLKFSNFSLALVI